MVNEDFFVDMARTCVGTCHVLKTVTEGRNVGSLRDLSQRQIEDLGRCIDLAQPPSADNNE